MNCMGAYAVQFMHGWTRHVAVMHDARVATNVRLREKGKPRNGLLYWKNNRTNNACIGALHFCEKHEGILLASSVST